MQHVLRVTCRIEGKRIANLRPLIHFRYERLAHAFHFVVIVVAGLVQQTQFESTGRTVAGHRGRFEEVDISLRDAFALLFQVFDNLLRRAFSVLPILQIDQAATRVGTCTLREDFETGQGRHAFDTFFLFCDFEQLLCHLICAFDGGTRRRFDHRIDHALVLLRNETGRESHVDPISQTAEEQGQDHGESLVAHRAPNESFVSPATGVEFGVETLQCTPHEAKLYMMFLLFGEDERTQCRG